MSGNFNSQLFGQQGSSFSTPFGSSSETSNQTTSFGFNTVAPANNTAFNTSSANTGASPFAGFSFGTPGAPVTAAKPPVFGDGMDSTATTQTTSMFTMFSINKTKQKKKKKN